MSTTDELRRLLDERGVEHYDHDPNPEYSTPYSTRDTEWSNDAKRNVLYQEWPNGTTRLGASNVSPAQAIAATLGESMTDTEKAALERRIDELCAEVERLKEREQNLVTLLRNDCDIEASWDGLRKFWYIGLTESGCLMRDRACKAEAENAKLREYAAKAWSLFIAHGAVHACDLSEVDAVRDGLRELGIEVPS